MFKLPKLEKPADYIQWRRRVKAYLRKDDYLLTCFTKRPQESGQEVSLNWDYKNANAKSIIILTLGVSVPAKTRLIVDDDDKTSKELWEELRFLYTTSNHQEIRNLHNRLNSLAFDEKRGS